MDLPVGTVLTIVGAMFGRGTSVADMVTQAGPMAKGVLLVLLGFSIISWAIIAHKFRLMRQIRRESRLFLEAFQDSSSLSAIYTRSIRMQYTPLAKIFIAGFRELKGSSDPDLRPGRGGKEGPSASDLAGNPNLAAVRRVLAIAVSEETARLEHALIFLATTGSTTPFIGLFGTVWGVMNAFRGLGMRGSASIGVVAPGIAEALIATAAGLAAAIPAVMAYNYFVNKVKFLAADMDNFANMFLAYVEKHRVNP